jgi:hypothetical protein
MDEQTFWDVCCANVLSLRFHPRNEVESYVAEVEFAATIADLAVAERRKRCQQHGHISEPQ